MITEYKYFIQYQNLFVCMIRYGSKKGKKNIAICIDSYIPIFPLHVFTEIIVVSLWTPKQENWQIAGWLYNVIVGVRQDITLNKIWNFVNWESNAYQGRWYYIYLMALSQFRYKIYKRHSLSNSSIIFVKYICQIIPILYRVIFMQQFPYIRCMSIADPPCTYLLNISHAAIPLDWNVLFLP